MKTALKHAEPDAISFDLASAELRTLNEALQALDAKTNETAWNILNPRGAHALAVGITAPVNVTIDGHVGYYCAGMNDGGKITITGNAGPVLSTSTGAACCHASPWPSRPKTRTLRP